MQKVFNVMSVASFVMSGNVVGTVLLFARIPSMIDDYMAADMIDDMTEDGH